MGLLNVSILGGCGTSTAFLNHLDQVFDACIALETDEAVYLLDAGDPANKLLRDRGLHKPVRGVFVTHLDGDHVNGLMPLLVDACRGGPCTVALPMPPDDLARLEPAWAALQGFQRPKHAPRFVPLNADFRFQDGDFCLETLPTRHNRSLQFMENLRVRPFVDFHPCFSFRVRYGGLRIVYSGDYESPAELDAWLREGADLAIVEYAHTALMTEYAAQLAAYDKLACVCFTHIGLQQGEADKAMATAHRALSTRTQVIKATPGIEFRFASTAVGVKPTVTSYEERTRGRTGVIALSAEEIRRFCMARGIPLAWSILGPFVNPCVNGRHTGLNQDHGVGLRPDRTRTFLGVGGQTIRWQDIPLDAIGQDGRIDLKNLIGGDDRLAYAYAEFTVPSDGRYEVLFGSDDGVRMWIDGREAFYLNQTRGAVPDQDRLVTALAAGRHDVMLAVDQHFGGWMYYWRIVPAEAPSHVPVKHTGRPKAKVGRSVPASRTATKRVAT